MVNDPTGFSAPPKPPNHYKGPNIIVLDGQGRELAQLFTHRDEIIMRTCGGTASTSTVSGTLSLLKKLLKSRGAAKALVPERPWATQSIHGVLLLAITNHWHELECADGDCYHLTLSYALPLALDARWRTWSENHIDELVDSAQLVAVPASHFVAVQPHQDLIRKHRRLLGVHRGTTVTEHQNVETYLDDWCRFSRGRYGYSIPDSELALLNQVLLMSGCRIREFNYREEVIGRSVVCQHPASRVLFDLMATWKMSAARLRPGIFSGVYNVLDALNRHMRYSLCYGRFPYKDEIVGPSARLTLRELING